MIPETQYPQRISLPLPATHPLVKNQDKCPICKNPFHAGQRTVLVPVRLSSKPETVPAIVLHAICAINGMDTPKGKITAVLEGNLVNCIVTDQGVWTLAELEFKS